MTLESKITSASYSGPSASWIRSGDEITRFGIELDFHGSDSETLNENAYVKASPYKMQPLEIQFVTWLDSFHITT